MDQLKTQLAVVLKYGFWIATSLVLIGSLAVWWLTTSKLAEESAKQTSKINNAISTVSSVSSELPTLPNDLSHAEMNRLIDARSDEVLQSWQTLYDRQRDILKWPVDELKQDFVDEFKDLIPIETSVDFPTPEEEEKETTLLSRYATYIKNVLPDIAKIAKTEWKAEFESSAGAGMMMMEGMDSMDMGMGGGFRGPTVDITGAREGPLVEWPVSSQQQLLEDLFPWRGKQPSTLQVLYSQENLWILRQLLQIIADVNGEARQSYQATIHQINKIGIGKSVKFGAGNISKPGTRPGGMGGMEMEMEMDMGMDMEMDMGSSMGGGFGSTVSIDPGDNRYVNASLEPISGSALRSALTSNSPNDASLAVAKRIPVMMSLNMDQRSVHELLAACGSAPLMVEVNQTRILPKSASAGGGTMGMMGGDEGMDDMGMGGMGMGMGGMGMGGGGAAPAPSMQGNDEFPLDMTVEIYGIIYIYNPPDPAKFGVEQVTEDTVIDGATATVGGQPVAPQAAATSDDADASDTEAAEATPADEAEAELPQPAAETTQPAPGTTAPAPATPDPATPAPAPDDGSASPPVTAAPAGGPPPATAVPAVQP